MQQETLAADVRIADQVSKVTKVNVALTEYLEQWVCNLVIIYSKAYDK